jgi:hypothetical protein
MIKDYKKEMTEKAFVFGLEKVQMFLFSQDGSHQQTYSDVLEFSGGQQ